MSPPTVRVVTVTFRSAATIGTCVGAVLDADGRGFELEQMTVVDNGSDDATVAEVPRDRGVRVIENAANLGFAAACNAGARGAQTDLLLFLNPDTRVQPDAIGLAAGTLHEQPAAAICGAALLDDQGEPVPCAARLPRLRSYFGEATGLSRVLPRALSPHLLELDGSGVREVEQVSGAFFLIRRHLFEEHGGFDEAYFLYYEEVDLTRRLAAAGWRSLVCLDARCFHEGGASSKSDLSERLFLNLQSRIIFGRRHLSPGRRALLYALTFGIEPVGRALHEGFIGSGLAGMRRVAAVQMRLVRWACSRAPMPAAMR